MRIYSNTPLSWPSLVHIYSVNRLSFKSWNNYHFYKIMSSDPVRIKHESPINYLKNNYNYSCYWNLVEYKNQKKSSNWEINIEINAMSNDYHKYYTNKLINYDINSGVQRYTRYYSNNYIYVPTAIKKGDLIVINNGNENAPAPTTPYRSHTSGNDIVLC